MIKGNIAIPAPKPELTAVLAWMDKYIEEVYGESWTPEWGDTSCAAQNYWSGCHQYKEEATYVANLWIEGKLLKGIKNTRRRRKIANELFVASGGNPDVVAYLGHMTIPYPPLD